tara:strand:+ start:280 stop:885 length:606 start_codon:yes stop_codon:yes gene_type:complete
MSKKQNISKRDTTPIFNHVVEKESSARGTYFDVTDEMTTHGTGNGEIIIRALGFNNMEEKKHWKKKYRPFGIRRDIGTNEAQLSRALLYMSDEGVEMDMSPELLKLNKQYFEKIKIPNLRKIQELRKNPTLKKVRKSAEVMTNEISHFSKNPDELKDLVAEQNAGLLEAFKSEEGRNEAIEALATTYIDSRKKALEKLSKL